MASEKKRGGRPRIDAATEEAVAILYNLDWPIEKIEMACKISRSTVFRIMRERRASENAKETAIH